MQTKDRYQWELDKEFKVSGTGNLCSDGWLHFYDSPELAVLLNPIHADIDSPRLFKAEVSGRHKDDHGLKCGWQKAKLVEELALPVFTLNQRVAFGILCALEVYQNEDFVKWADNWLSGVDRSRETARAAAWATGSSRGSAGSSRGSAGSSTR